MGERVGVTPTTNGRDVAIANRFAKWKWCPPGMLDAARRKAFEEGLRDHPNGVTYRAEALRAIL